MNNKLTDFYGVELHEGDLVLEHRGINVFSNEKTFSYMLYEIPNPEEYDGHGVIYSSYEEKTDIAWTFLKNAAKIDKNLLDKNILFTFHHGRHTLNSPAPFNREKNNAIEIIKSSDIYKFIITEEDYKNMEIVKNLEFNSMQDIIDNLDLLKKHSTTSTAKKVLEFAEVEVPPIYNGELGIYLLYLSEIYRNFLNTLEKWK